MSSPSHDKLPDCIQEMLDFERCKLESSRLRFRDKCSDLKKNLKHCFQTEKFWPSEGKATSFGKESAK